MKTPQKNYMVLIPSSAHCFARPVRVSDDVMRQIRALTSPAVVPYSVGEGYVLHCVFGVPGNTDGRLNFNATVLMGERGKSAYGDAVLCRLGKDDYEFMTKPEAKAVAEIINLIN